MSGRSKLLRFWNGTLTGVFWITILLSLFMVNWILIFPSSWLQGNNSLHDKALSEAILYSESRGRKFPLPHSILLKYSGQWAIQFTHTLPALGWSALIPLQIYPSAKRLQYHRELGYLFVLFGFMMVVGLCVIDYRGLVFIHFDFPNIAANDHMSAMGFDFICHDWLMRATSVWFLTSLSLSVHYARQKQFAAHRRFMYRHIASGLWVAVQRLWVIGIQPQEETYQKAVFADGVVVGLCFTVALSEVAIFSISQINELEKVAEKQK